MDIENLKQSQNRYFASGATLTLEFRRAQLLRFRERFREFEPAICAAIERDLGKSAKDTFLTELSIIDHEVHVALKNLARWMRPRNVKTPLHLLPARSQIYREPRGVVLIIAPWNFPAQLTLVPLVDAIAAGCCAILKPSELTPKTSKVLGDLVSAVFAPEHVAVVQGGVDESQRLLALPFDHIFFTGSTRVGRLVYQAAAQTLTPVTLELGGKCPAIVAADCDLEITARRLAWGKILNAGQTCVAPDYVYAHRSIAPRLLELLKTHFENAKPSCQRVINAAHFDRLFALTRNATVYCGGDFRRDGLSISPTILTGVDWDSPAMREEIFGPILPVLTFDSIDEAFANIEKRDRPLSAYLFTRDPALFRSFSERLSFGGGCVNDCVVHVSNSALPFGGVGASGLGAYHGERGFLTFSHEKSVMSQPTWIDLPLRYVRTQKVYSIVRRIFGFRKRS